MSWKCLRCNEQTWRRPPRNTCNRCSPKNRRGQHNRLPSPPGPSSSSSSAAQPPHASPSYQRQGRRLVTPVHHLVKRFIEKKRGSTVDRQRRSPLVKVVTPVHHLVKRFIEKKRGSPVDRQRRSPLVKVAPSSSSSSASSCSALSSTSSSSSASSSSSTSTTTTSLLPLVTPGPPPTHMMDVALQRVRTWVKRPLNGWRRWYHVKRHRASRCVVVIFQCERCIMWSVNLSLWVVCDLP